MDVSIGQKTRRTTTVTEGIVTDYAKRTPGIIVKTGADNSDQNPITTPSYYASI